MTRHVFSFLAAFALGCIAALAVRSAWFQPYAVGDGGAAAVGYAPMVDNSTASAASIPASAAAPPAAVAPAADPHAGHAGTAPRTTVNTVCALCGMDVDPSIEPATYQGKLIGFGCRMCPPKFARDPDRYGPAALANQVVED
jgi:hypothetical protein